MRRQAPVQRIAHLGRCRWRNVAAAEALAAWGTGTVESGGSGSSRERARGKTHVDACPSQVNSWPLRACRVGITQSNMSIARAAPPTRRSARRADPHDVARAIGLGIDGATARHRRVHLPGPARRPTDRPAPCPSKGSGDSSAQVMPRAAQRRDSFRPGRSQNTAALCRGSDPCRASIGGAAGPTGCVRSIASRSRRRLGVAGRAVIEHHADVRAQLPPGPPTPSAGRHAMCLEPSKWVR